MSRLKGAAQPRKEEVMYNHHDNCQRWESLQRPGNLKASTRSRDINAQSLVVFSPFSRGFTDVSLARLGSGTDVGSITSKWGNRNEDDRSGTGRDSEHFNNWNLYDWFVWWAEEKGTTSPFIYMSNFEIRRFTKGTPRALILIGGLYDVLMANRHYAKRLGTLINLTSSLSVTNQVRLKVIYQVRTKKRGTRFPCQSACYGRKPW